MENWQQTERQVRGRVLSTAPLSNKPGMAEKKSLKKCIGQDPT